MMLFAFWKCNDLSILLGMFESDLCKIYFEGFVIRARSLMKTSDTPSEHSRTRRELNG
jgi:hypothetical protein